MEAQSTTTQDSSDPQAPAHLTIREGWEVYTASGHKLGIVAEVYVDRLLVHKSQLFGKKELQVPRTSVQRSDTTKKRVYLDRD
ncbi:MAG TPA: PRC-barrel domain-containing protein [Chloroflexota bacterium]|nr:PRC-barrel domain-containing protein [Chloroflexota bacterium]